MEMEKKTSKILVTSNYGKFKRLEGNRGLRQRAKKIKKSIQKVGYIPSPIVVNEKYEVVDGQARLQVLQELGLPVYYIVIPGIGIEECIAMNINTSNWSIRDYIESHSETGNISYTYLLNLMKAHGTKMKQRVILSLSANKFDYVPLEEIKTGMFQMTEEEYVNVDRLLTWLEGFYEIFKRVKGHNEHYYTALAFCYRDPVTDTDRLRDKIEQLQASLIPVTTTQQALDEIERIYNNRARDKVHIKNRYRETLEGKYSWYSSRYGCKY